MAGICHWTCIGFGTFAWIGLDLETRIPPSAQRHHLDSAFSSPSRRLSFNKPSTLLFRLSPTLRIIPHRLNATSWIRFSSRQHNTSFLHRVVDTAIPSFSRLRAPFSPLATSAFRLFFFRFEQNIPHTYSASTIWHHTRHTSRLDTYRNLRR